MNDTENELDEKFNITLERTPGLNGRITLDPVGGVITIHNDGKLDSPIDIYANDKCPSYYTVALFLLG